MYLPIKVIYHVTLPFITPTEFAIPDTERRDNIFEHVN